MEREDPGREWSTDLGQRGERGDDAQSVICLTGEALEGWGLGATVALGHGRKVLLVEHLKSQPLSKKVQRQLDRPRKKNTEHKAGSAVKTMLNAKTFRSERRAKHGDKR